jgi:hypothetical protein
MKKCFLLTQFGTPHPWTQKFIDHVQFLGQYGWYFKIFTPNSFESKGNVEVISMDIDGFNTLVEKKLGVNPKMFIAGTGVPSFHMTDFNVILGAIFEDYTKDCDYWGCLGWDVLLGHLDHFIPEKELVRYDVWSDDVNIVNGTFCLFRNIPEVNDLFKKIPLWKEKLVQTPCPACTGSGGEHHLYGTDEYDFTEVMRKDGNWFGYPKYYPIHGHDRLQNHKIELKDDGSLWELNKDTPPEWIHKHEWFGREIGYFHFLLKKTWPL